MGRWIIRIDIDSFIHSHAIFFMAQQPLMGQGRLIIEASRSHSDTPHSVVLLWTRDRCVAEASTRQHTTLTRDRFEPAIPASERPQTHALEIAATVIGHFHICLSSSRRRKAARREWWFLVIKSKVLKLLEVE
jgi:hypothetical protein